MKRFLALAALGLLCAASPLHAAPMGQIKSSVEVCDPNSPTHCVAPNADGSITTTPAASSTQAIGGTSTAAAPSYVEGATAQPLSLDLSGNLRAAAVGNVASGATDSGNPVLQGAVFETAPTAVTSGQRTRLHASANGVGLAAVSNAAGTIQAGVGNPGNSDAQSAVTGGMSVGAFTLGYNGSTWDRVKISAGKGLQVEQGPFLRGRATADAQIKGSAGFVHSIAIAPLTATPTAGLLTVYDNTAESGTVIYSEWIFATTPGHSIDLDVPADVGIYVGYDSAITNVQLTVSYR